MKKHLLRVLGLLVFWIAPALAQPVTTTVPGNLLTYPFTFGGRVITAAPTVSAAGLNLPAGTAPTVPVNGDLWTTTSGVFARINGSTVGPFGAGGGISALTGDVTGSGTGSIATTLATVNGNLGTFGSTTQVGSFVVNAKGLITSASNIIITPSNIGALATGLTSANIFVGNGSNIAAAVALSGDCTLANTGAITCTKTNGSALGTMALQSAAAVAITGGTITGLGNPTASSDAANKSYVDSVATGLVVHAAAQWATAAVLPNTPVYNNGAGTLTAGSNAAIVVDGGNPVLNDRVVVKNQASGFQNGVYSVTTVGSGGVPWVLTRVTDFNTVAAGNIATNAYFFSSGGSTNAGTSWVMTTPAPITLGVTTLAFTQFGASTAYTAGTGLTLGGSVFSITNTIAAAGPVGAATTVPVITYNAQGQLTTVTTASITPAAIGAASANLTSGNILVGNGSNVAASVALSGDCTMANTGAITCTKTGGVAFGTNATSSVSFLPLAGGTMTGDLLFTDNTFDIGKSGATRPRDGFFSRNIVATGGGSFVGGKVSLTDVTNGAIELGGISTFPFIDFHSSASVNDYDVRIQASGGNASSGNGALQIYTSGVGVSGRIIIENGVGIPAGGSTGFGYAFSSTPNFGMFYGSGSPTLSAARGSLYLRSDGGPYVNTNGSTGWSSLTGSAVINAVTGCGVDNTGSADVGATITTCLNTNLAVGFPCGTYKTSTVIVIPTAGAVLGSGLGCTLFTSTSTTLGVMKCAEGSFNVIARDFSVSRSVVATSSAYGFGCGTTGTTEVETAQLENIRVDKAWNGFQLGATNYSYGRNLISVNNLGDCFALTNSASVQLFQWQFDRLVGEFCDGYGMHITAVNGATNSVVGGLWSEPNIFANTLGGIYFQAVGTAIITDISLVGGSISGNGSFGLKLTTNGGVFHRIQGGLYELTGQIATGSAGTTPAGGTGAGIEITNLAAQLTITGATIEGNSQDGVLIDAGAGASNVAITGSTITSNSRQVANTNSGINVQSGTAVVSISNNVMTDASFQRFGIVSSGGTTMATTNQAQGVTGGCSGTTFKPAGGAAAYNVGTSCP